MSSRPLIAPFLAINAGDMSADITSKVTVLQMLSHVSYMITWTGATPIGSIVVEASNDYSQNADGTAKNAGHWNAMPLSATTDVSGNVDSGMIDIDGTAIYAIRLRYVRTSGTGVMNAVLIGKVA